MTMVNQKGDPIQEEEISFSYLMPEEQKEAIDLLFKHLGFEIIRTNATDNGAFALELRVQELLIAHAGIHPYPE